MSMTEAAKQIRKLIEITANNLTDEQASELPYCFPEWEEGVEAKEGERYRVKSIATYARTANTEQEGMVLFKCKKTHTTTAENAPEESPELWEAL